jgi:hypothetical protein
MDGIEHHVEQDKSNLKSQIARFSSYMELDLKNNNTMM